ncbi:MAG: NAD(P)-binding domain-containing protein [Nitrospirota bacterium]|nr:NAD(P)-binding domain-containing protein [Nitrospirota bacterium]
MLPNQIDTIVIGNGPAGVCASLGLAGYRPYYRGVHPDPVLHAELFSARHVPLTQMPVPAATPGMSARAGNPVGRFFDAVHHPVADHGGRHAGCLELRHHPERAVNHLVLGSGQPGGSWNRMPPGMRTLSRGYWMELPGLTMEEWGRSQGRWPGSHDPIDRAEVAGYYGDLVERMGLLESFISGVTVTRAEPDGDYWRVAGHGPREGDLFTLRCRRLVLAVGMYDRVKRLGIPGEDSECVTHRVPAQGEGPLLVVGAGLSAGDAILMARAQRRPVIHAFVDDPEQCPMARLSPDIYTDYYSVARQMAEPVTDGYEPLPGTRLVAVDPDGTCHLEYPAGRTTRQVAQVAVLIGSLPDLSLLPPDMLEVEDVIPTDRRTFRTPFAGLYAIGPMAGDNFVRFITGHGFWAAADIAGDSVATSTPRKSASLN